MIICNMRRQIINLFSDESENLERRKCLGDLSIEGRTEHYHGPLIVCAPLSTFIVTFSKSSYNCTQNVPQHYRIWLVCIQSHYESVSFVAAVIILLNNII